MFGEVSIATGGEEAVHTLADAVVYYNNTSFETGPGDLVGLTQRYGFEVVRDLVDGGDLRLQFSRHYYVVNTDRAMPPTHQFLAISMTRDADQRPVRSEEDAIAIAFRRGFPGDPSAEIIAREFSDRIVKRPYYPDIERLAEEDTQESSFFAKAMAVLINDRIPNAVDPNRFYARCIDMGEGRFVFDTDFDFAAAKNLSPFGPADLLASLMSARQALLHAAQFDGDVWLASRSNAVIELRLNSVANKIESESSDRSHFEHVYFQGRSFSDAVRSGHRSPKELLAFVQSDETRRMKQWIATRSNDTSLVVEYVKACEGRGLMDGVPARATKVAIFTGLGAVADVALGSPGIITSTAAGIAIGSADEFLASRLKLGWRPSTWVSKAQEFLRS